MIISWDVCVEYFEDADKVEHFISDHSEHYYNPGGTMGIAFFLGPGTQEQAELTVSEGRPAARLRVDLDAATGCGAARWYEGDLMAVEESYEPRGFGTWSGRFAPVPFTVARVGYTTALRLAIEYARTGIQPVSGSGGSVSWTGCDWMD